VSVHGQLRVKPGGHKRLTDLSQTYPEALAQSPGAAGPACRPAPLPGPLVAVESPFRARFPQLRVPQSCSGTGK
jgi:hypothetical protein